VQHLHWRLQGTNSPSSAALVDLLINVADSTDDNATGVGAIDDRRTHIARRLSHGTSVPAVRLLACHPYGRFLLTRAVSESRQPRALDATCTTHHSVTGKGLSCASVCSATAVNVGDHLSLGQIFTVTQSDTTMFYRCRLVMEGGRAVAAIRACSNDDGGSGRRFGPVDQAGPPLRAGS
jgi:hypothetical protein